ncbi:MAG: hypothetical protein P4L98_24295 [Ancalomicrobiaceae bacterium]|nr:hypothetical protein [Ancalomicrobiaceae bacterium]
MKSISVVLLAASLSVLSTAAFAQPSDSIDINVARQVALGNAQASNDSAQGVVEGRQAAHANSTLSASDQLLLELAVQRDISHH